VVISDGAVITCSSESCGKVVNKSNIQPKSPSIVTHIHVTICVRFVGKITRLTNVKENSTWASNLKGLRCENSSSWKFLVSLWLHVTQEISAGDLVIQQRFFHFVTSVTRVENSAGCLIIRYTRFRNLNLAYLLPDSIPALHVIERYAEAYV
jgi:hypothetical protein